MAARGRARYAGDVAVLEREQIIQALERLNERLRARGERADLFLVGGAVMCLVHRVRPSTRDVDAWFSNPRVVRAAAREVAEEMGLPEDWLNDAAKAFVPPGARFETWASLSNLTVSTADPRTLLAMKCAAARTEQDASDMRHLARILGLTNAQQVLDIVVAYYPPDRLPVRTRLLVEEMFGGRA